MVACNPAGMKGVGCCIKMNYPFVCKVSDFAFGGLYYYPVSENEWNFIKITVESACQMMAGWVVFAPYLSRQIDLDKCPEAS